MDRHYGDCKQGYSGLHWRRKLVGSAAGKGEILTEFAKGRGGDERPKILPYRDRLNQIAAPAPDGRLHCKPAIRFHTEHHIEQ